MMSEFNSGFTLIEIMMVILIIAILASVALLTLNSHSVLDESKKVRAMQQLKNLRRALALYNLDFNQYPDNLTELYTNSESEIYLKKDYIENKLKKDKKIFNYQSKESHKNYNVDIELDSGIKLTLTPEKITESK